MSEDFKLHPHRACTGWFTNSWHMEVYYDKYVCYLSAINFTKLFKYFYCVSKRSMWPLFLRVTSWSRWHVFVITRLHVSFSVPLHNSTNILLISDSSDDFRGNSFSFKKTRKKKEVKRIQTMAEKRPKFAAIFTIRLAVWFEARGKKCSRNQLIKIKLTCTGVYTNRCTKSPATCSGTPCLLSSGSLHGSVVWVVSPVF